MKFTFTLPLFLLILAAGLPARAAGELPESLSREFDAKACATVADAGSPCNQGAEPFSKFIGQFNSSLKFRAIRMKCDERLQDFLLTPWWKTGRTYRFLVQKPDRTNDFTLMSWTDPTHDSVWMIAGYMPPSADDDAGLNAAFHFRRVAGKWYLVDGFVKDQKI